MKLVKRPNSSKKSQKTFMQKYCIFQSSVVGLSASVLQFYTLYQSLKRVSVRNIRWWCYLLILWTSIYSEVGNKQEREPQGCQRIIQNITINKSLSISGQIFTKSALHFLAQKYIKKKLQKKGKDKIYSHLSSVLEYN